MINIVINNILIILINNIAIISIISKIKNIVNNVIKSELANNLDAFRRIKLINNYYLKK